MSVEVRNGLLIGAVVGAVVPWGGMVLLLFTAKLIVSLMVGMQEIWYLIAIVIGFAAGVREHFVAGLIGAAIGFGVAAVLMMALQGLLGATNSGLAGALTMSTFLPMAGWGAGGGAVCGALFGLHRENGTTQPTPSPVLPPPTAARPTSTRRARITFKQPSGDFNGMKDAKTLQPLDQALGIHKCRKCGNHYHTASKESLQDGKCYGCDHTTFDRVA